MSEEIPVYNETVRMLKDFRRRILSDLVSARVNARLNASHDTMQKYSRLLDRLSIVPYVFGRIREHALALRINGNDIGSGEMRKIVASYTGGLAEYPTGRTINVPLRNLPLVDVFHYDPPTIANVADLASEELWSNYFTLQVTRGKYKETPDVQNAFFDYYKLRPIGRAYFELSLSNQEIGFENYATIKGEATVLARSITPVSEETAYDYVFYVFLDADFFGTSGKITSVPMVFVVTSDTALNPKQTVLAGGKRLFTDSVGVYTSNIIEGQFVGWTKIAGGYSVVTENITWSNMSTLKIMVNDPSLGTTDPPPDIHKYKAIEEETVNAIPEPGYTVVRWELDGVQYSPSDSFTVKMYRNHELLCVFGTTDVFYLRPNDDIEQFNVRRYPSDTVLYTQIDEEISDGDATYVHDWITGRHDPLYTCGALFGFPSITLPSGNVIDSVRVYVRAKSTNVFYPGQVALWIRTHGRDYVTDYDWVYDTYTVKSYEWKNNPYTGEPWTADEVNTLLAGFQGRIDQPNLLETGDYLRVTQLWIEVPYHSV